MKKKLATIMIVLILCIDDTEAAAPPVDFAATCESEQGCERRLTGVHEKLKIYMEIRGKKGRTAKQIERKVKKACSDSQQDTQRKKPRNTK